MARGRNVPGLLRRLHEPPARRPGIGSRASWAPNLLVAEAFTILPIGFVLCLWGTPVGRTLATGCGLTMLVVALAATSALSRSPAELLVFFAFVAPPAIALLACVARMRKASAADAVS